VNLSGFFHFTQLAIAEMEKRHGGHVVQITTSLIEHANSHVPSVLASLTKGGLSAATRSLAIEYAKRGIRVNAVAPGVIKTPMHPVETHAQLAELHPLGRMGQISWPRHWIRRGPSAASRPSGFTSTRAIAAMIISARAR
jgi:NAD(P)-dependent dehydrogenase (short-subunit alcohol dehydrogenase family)